MRARGAVLTVVCTGVALVGAHPTQAQEATSANLPDQFQTGEMIQIQKPKKKKAESRSQALATAAKQNPAPVPEQTPTAEEAATHMAPPEDKKAEPPQSNASTPPREKVGPATEHAPPAAEPEIAAEPAEMKPRAKRRSRRAVQPEAASISAPVPMSLSVAQSMATSAPLPGYSYEAKRRNLTGNGVCVMTVDTTTGRVTNAMMYQSTGNAILDNLTIQTFKSWRFKPGTVSQVRVPISYE
jgi:TonB family protein